MFAANLEVALHTSSRLGPWGVYWSLAVEEHFYLLWPLLVLRCTRKTLVITTCSILLVSPILRAVAINFLDPMFLYYLTPFRLDGLAVGSLLAILLTDRLWTERLNAISLPVALLLPVSMVLLSLTDYRTTLFFNILGYSLIAFGSAGVVFLLVEDSIPLLTKLLQTSVLRAIGAISFTLYLIQEPMMHGVTYLARTRNFNHGIRTTLAATILAFLYATLSWHLMEKPILSRNHRRKLKASPVVSNAL
jgi:peptidoglycan/LPS O-acetylase OafA/YrhL